MFALVLTVTLAAPVVTLEQAIELADRQSVDINILRERLAQADAAATRAWTTLLPALSAIGTYTRNSAEAVLPFADPEAGYTAVPLPAPAPPGSLGLIPNAVDEIVIQPRDQYVGIVQASLPVFAMPAYLGISAARKAAALTDYSLSHARNELVFGVAQVYYGAIGSARVIELAEKQLEVAREQERVARGRYEAGELARVGFLRSGVERARAEQDLRRAQNGHAGAKLALATLIGLEGDFTVESPPKVEAPGGSEAELLERAREGRNDLRAARLGTEAAGANTAATVWRFAPIVSLNGQYRWTNFASFTGENESWLVGLTAAINFDFGRFAEVSDARSRERESQLQVEKVERAIVQDVKNAVLDLESARANQVKAAEQERLATESLALVQAQFSAGAAGHLELVDATNARFSAGIAAVSEELNVQLAALRLAKAVGGLGPARASP